MKVAVVSIGSFDTQYSDYHIMKDIIIGLLSKGNTVELVQKQYFETPNYPKAFRQYLGKQLIVHNIRFKKKAKSNLKARYLGDIFYYYQACRLLKKSKPDKIFLQSNNTAFFMVFYAKHILKRPLLYNEQDIFPENAYFAGILSERSVVYKVTHMLQKYAYKNATVLSTISEDMKSTIVTRYGIPENNVSVIYNWGHEELKAHSELENVFLQKYPKKPGEFRVVYAGNLGKMQNVELVLEAAALMKDDPEITFYIVGGGVNEEQLKTYAKEKALSKVTFVRMQPSEEVADLYASADINVIPLIHGLIYAALPSKTADCLIAGKPMITCLDEHSKFVQLIRSYGIVNTGTECPEQLRKTILQIQCFGLKCRNAELWKDYFMAEKSVAAYCDLVEEMV